MDKESFAALLEEAKNNIGTKYLLNEMILYYGNNRWTLEFSFNEFFVEGEGVTICVGNQYIGTIDPREIKRVKSFNKTLQ